MTEPNHESRTTSRAEPLTDEQLDELAELWIGKPAVAEIRTLREDAVKFREGVIGLQVTIDTIEADNAKLRAEVDDLCDGITEVNNEGVKHRRENAKLREATMNDADIIRLLKEGTCLVQESAADNAKLREALERYGDHEWRCIWSKQCASCPNRGTLFGDKWYKKGEEPTCTCGLADALVGKDDK